MLIRLLVTLAALLIATFVDCAAHAATQAPGELTASEAQFAARVHERFPGTQTAVIAPAFPGFHYVAKDGEVLFVRDDLSVLVTGNVVDLSTNRSLVADIKARNPRRADLSRLDPKDAIHIGHGTRRLYVFSDPDCPYCRTLQAELAKLHDVEVLLYPYPLEGLHPNAKSVAKTLWCQGDRESAWNDYVLKRVMPKPAADCATPVDRNVAIGAAIGIRATPTLILPNGALVEGSEQAERIEAQLAEISK